jgi:cytochrome c-type biogenesis protein CcmH
MALPMKYRLLLPAVLFLALLSTGAALAQTATPIAVTDDQVNAVASELFCPECENIPLDVCPSQACADMRAEIRQKLQQGWTKAQIKQYYVERYGDRVVGAPPARGWNWLMYLIPPVAILASAAILYRVFRTWKQSPRQPVQTPADSQNPPVVDNDYVARLEAELKKAKK